MAVYSPGDREIHVGDLLRLKSGSPVMVANRVSVTNGTVECMFYNTITGKIEIVDIRKISLSFHEARALPNVPQPPRHP